MQKIDDVLDKDGIVFFGIRLILPLGAIATIFPQLCRMQFFIVTLFAMRFV